MMSFYSYLFEVLVGNIGLSGLSISKHKEIYKEWRGQIKSKRSPIEEELPWLTIIAKNYLEEALIKRQRNECKVFEFGSGGSSLFFLKYAEEVISVEHDKEWFGLVGKCIEKKDIKGWKGHLLEPEFIGPAARQLDFGDPKQYYTSDEKFSEHTFKNYASHISNYPDNYFDIVLVDGRSRPSCLFHGLNKVKKGGLLVLDNAERKYYLAQNVIPSNDFRLVLSSWGALICYDQYTRTNIYVKN